MCHALQIRPLLEAPARADGETAALSRSGNLYSCAQKPGQITDSYAVLQTRFRTTNLKALSAQDVKDMLNPAHRGAGSVAKKPQAGG
jgi:hypothetical protein